MKVPLNNLRRNEDGATAVEYGLLAGLISIALISLWQAIGFDLRPIFQFAADNIEQSTPESQDGAN